MKFYIIDSNDLQHANWAGGLVSSKNISQSITMTVLFRNITTYAL